MTRFTVVWHEDSLNRLAEIWMTSSDRNGVTESANAIDIELSQDPQSKGTEVEGNLRLLTRPPLSVLFVVSEPDRLVKVVHVDMA